MFKSLWRALKDEYSGMAAYQAVADISRYHRIQASPGFRRAAEYVHEKLAGAGVQAEILGYQANTETSFWGARAFQEWSARAGTLHLIEPQDQARKLADYREVPLSLIPRSVAFDGEVDVIAVEKGEEPAEYERLDVAGKVVLARGNVQRVYDLAVLRRGAVGVLFDGMAEIEPVRPAWALPDAIQYSSFWWHGEGPRCFGFALSPREGERLRRLIRKRQENGEGSVRLRARVDAQLYDGTLEVIDATIPGQSDEEVVLVGHLCHPQPSCNDNASGSAALLEVARALQSLIAAGELSRPRRTLRFLWVPEMTGTYAFLASNESYIPRMVAGLNLDMVGQDQVQCGGSFLLERPPDALSSFAPDLLACLREMLFPEFKTHAKLDAYPLFRHAVTSFSGGSDHYIFSDPSVGVPMPTIIQWPDKFYHTTADTLDRVDPAMLGKVCTLTAAYAYWLAGAGEPEARWLASEMSARFRQRIIGMVQRAATDADEDSPGRETLRRQLEYQVERHREALASLTRLAPLDVSDWQAGDASFAEAEFARIARSLPQRLNDVSQREENQEAARLIPRRLVRGPLWVAGYVSRLDEAGRDEWWELGRRIGEKTSQTVPVLAQYWADGQRTIEEIGGLITLETGLEAMALLVEYFRFLERLGLVHLEETGQGRAEG
jgi:aminopeptidase YwaD